ncbi:hypothetical protein E1I69_07475 [Bacillus timonensis]|uniref:Uncharacterized protein n=1 Tax=Bacillus timonensis TaxID=1033734 RepID=A0A4S3PVK9_9BACI|nr:hypothetical protein [Bacillus timonensis]THE13446.1 hypothetical protein E1I69_07475 [Bacillus timonensis]
MKKIVRFLSYLVLCIAVVMIFFYFGKDDSPKQDDEVWHVTDPTEAGVDQLPEAEVEADKLPEDEVSTSLKGGIMDSYSFIEKQMELVETSSVSREYVLDDIKVNCLGDNGICVKSTYYFQGEENPTTPEEAFQLLKDHLPKDSVVQEEFKLDEKRYVYNVTSDLLKENFSGLGGFYDVGVQGKFHLIFTFHPGTKEIILVVADLLYHI